MDKLRLKWQVVMESLYDHQRKHPISSILVKRIEIIQADVARHLEILTGQLNNADSEVVRLESRVLEKDLQIQNLQSELELEQEKTADLVVCINQLNGKLHEEMQRTNQAALYQMSEKISILKRKNLDYELRLMEADSWRLKLGERLKLLGQENEGLKDHLLHYRIKETDLSESLEQHTKAYEQRESLFEEAKLSCLIHQRKAGQLESALQDREKQLLESQQSYQHLVNDYNILKREYELLKQSMQNQDETQERVYLNASLLKEESSRIQLQKLEALDYSKLRGDTRKESIRDETFTIDEELSEIGGPVCFNQILFRDEYKLSPDRLTKTNLHQHATLKKSLNKQTDKGSKELSPELHTVNQAESPAVLKDKQRYFTGYAGYCWKLSRCTKSTAQKSRITSQAPVRPKYSLLCPN